MLCKLLDRAALAALRDSFFGESPPPARREAPSRPLTSRLPLRLRQRLRARLRATGLLRGGAGGYPPRGRTDPLRCIALIAQPERELPSFADGNAAPGRH